MQNIGRYKQMTEFTTENAGTAEWCRASLDGVDYFVKKFQSPVYPSGDVELPEKKMKARILRFHNALENKKKLYERLNAQNSSGALLVPVEVMNYQYHICTIAEFVTGNVRPQDVCHLNEWQRLVLMRTLTRALMNVHAAGIVHSDMKPENVVIEQSEEGNCRLRLIDFDGSFFMEDAPNKADAVHGDPAYFSPEAYRLSMGEEVTLDYRIDIFALGMIMHYFWCGRLPEKPADRTVGECVLRGESITLKESLPLALRMTIMKMLDVNPDMRLTLSDVDSVLDALIRSGMYPPRPLVVIARKPDHIPPYPKPKPDPNPARVRTITVLEVDTKGNTINSRKVDVPYGESVTVVARNINGYRVISDHERRVSVSKTGTTSITTLRFTYEKVTKRKMSVAAIVWLCILGTAITIGIIAAIVNGNRRPGGIDEAHRVNTISVNNSIYTNSSREYYYFTPSVTREYTVYTAGSADTAVFISQWNGRAYEEIATDDNSGSGLNFSRTVRLEAGTTYRFEVKQIGYYYYTIYFN